MDPKAKKPRKRHTGSRNHRFVMKLTETELKAIRLRAKRAELTPTEYARAKALDVSRTTNDRAPSTNRKLLSQAVSQMGEATKPLRRVAEAMESGEQSIPVHRIELALTRIETVTEAMLRALGVDIP